MNQAAVVVVAAKDQAIPLPAIHHLLSQQMKVKRKTKTKQYNISFRYQICTLGTDYLKTLVADITVQ